MKPTKKATRSSLKKVAATTKKTKGFTAEERAAMRERVQELKAESRRGPTDQADGENAVLAKIIYAGSNNTSFQQAQDELDHLAELDVSDGR